MTTKKCKTEQEAFWAGEFGDQYIGHNCAEEQISRYQKLIEKYLGEDFEC